MFASTLRNRKNNNRSSSRDSSSSSSSPTTTTTTASSQSGPPSPSSSSSSSSSSLQVETIEVTERNHNDSSNNRNSDSKISSSTLSSSTVATTSSTTTTTNSSSSNMEEPFDGIFVSNSTTTGKAPATVIMPDNSTNNNNIIMDINSNNNNNNNTLLPSSSSSQPPSPPATTDDLATFLSGFLPLFFMLAVCFCSSANRRGEDRSVYFRGRMMRMQYRENERRRLDAESRKEFSPEQRQQQIANHLKTMTVQSKHRRTAEDGTSDVGKLEFRLQPCSETSSSSASSCCENIDAGDDHHDHDNVCHTSSSLSCDGISEGMLENISTDDVDSDNDIENQVVIPPSSPNGVDAFPLDNPSSSSSMKKSSSSSSSDSVDENIDDHVITNNDCDQKDVNDTDSDDYQDGDDDDVCHICLDTFDVGDRVMWAKHDSSGSSSSLSCRHVFHEECLMPWLMDKRENDCPSCRRCLIHPTAGDGIDDKDAADGDNDMSNNSSSNNNNNSDVTNQRNSPSSSSIPNKKRDVEEGIEMTLTSSNAILEDEMDGKYRYAIVKGLIERIPLTSTETACHQKTSDRVDRLTHLDVEKDDVKYSRYEITHTPSTDTTTTALTRSSTSGSSRSNSEDDDDDDESRSSNNDDNIEISEQQQQQQHYRCRRQIPITTSRPSTDNLRLPTFDQRMDIVNSLVAASSSQQMMAPIPLQRRRSSFLSHGTTPNHYDDHDYHCQQQHRQEDEEDILEVPDV